MAVTKPNETHYPYGSYGNIYVTNREGAEQFVKRMMNASFIDDLSTIFQNPMDSVVSLRYYPYNVLQNSLERTPVAGDMTDETKLFVGKFDLNKDGGLVEEIFYKGVKCKEIENNMTPVTYTLNVGAVFNGQDFKQYEPYTEMQLYLPYVGFVHISPYDVVGKTITVSYVVDYMTGNGTVYVERPNALTGVNEIILTSECKISIDIPITGRNAYEIQRNWLTLGLGTVGGNLESAGRVLENVEGVVDAVASVIGAVPSTIAGLPKFGINAINASQVKITKGVIGDGYNAFYSPQTPYLVVRTQTVNEPIGYAAHYGRPSAKRARIGSLEGFTKVAAVHLENVATATQDELTEIERLLTAGVIL